MKNTTYFLLSVFISIFLIQNISYSQCSYRVDLFDTFGDGWNGGTLTIEVNSIVVLVDLTLSTGTGPESYFFTVNTGDLITATYTAGNWAAENEYYVYDANGVEIFSDGVGGATPAATASIGTATCPSCPAPNSLIATNISDVSADLGWTETGTATVWNIEYGLTGFTQGAGTLITGTSTNPHNLSGLSASTTYDFYVQSDCGAGDTSIWIGPYTFTTAVCALTDQCTYTLIMTDQGNSWNGAAVEVIQDGVSMGSFTVPNGGANTDSVALCNGSNIQLVWTSGTFDNETIFDFQDPNGLSLYSWSAGGSPSAGVFYTFTASCAPVTCPYPSDLNATNITTTSADLGWTENGTATVWNIEYGLSGFTQGTGTIVNGITTNPYPATGLTSSAYYDFYVQADCGGGDLSFWVGPFTFATSCDIFIAPYFQDFESGGNIPVCWINDVSDFFDWSFNTVTPSVNTGPQSGDHTTGSGYFAYTEASNPNNPNQQADLLTPWIDVSALTAPALSFWYHMYGAGMGDLHIDVNDGTWNNDVLILSGDNGDVWTEAIINLSAFSSPLQVRFRGITGSNYLSDMSIDDVSFNEMPSCPQPTALSVDSVLDTLAVLGWTETGSATTWIIEYGPSGFTQGTGTLISGITTNPYMITGLSSATNYDFYVMSDCGGGDSSTWSGPVSFTTLITPVSNPSSCEIGIPVPDPGCIDLPIIVNTTGTQLGGDIFLSDVNIILTHTFDQDLSISLESPNGVVIDLSSNNGGNGDNYGIVDGTCTQYTNFNMLGIDGSITAGTAPFTGSFVPEGDFVDFNDNSNPNGLWILSVCDGWNTDAGTIEYIELVFEQILPPAEIIINEADVSQLGTDTVEFVEIYDGGIGNYPLDEYVVVFYNGSTDQCYQSFDLDGYSTDSSGYFVLGNADVPNVGLIFADNLLQDGADAIALYKDSAVNFPVGAALTLTNLEDALVYETNDLTDLQLLALLNNGQPQIDEDMLGNKEAHSCSRLPNGSGGQRNTYTYYAAMPTPGAANNGVPEIVWNTQIFVESLANDGSIETIGDVELKNNDFAFIGLLTENIHYTTANVPAGLAVEITTTTDTTATIILTGNAVSHLNADDINNLTITFTDTAYGTYNSVFVINNSNSALTVDFFDTPPPTIVWDNYLFNENALDNGSITDTINLALVSETFVISSGLLTENIHYVTANVPAGLAVEINITTDTSAVVSLTGNAISHDNINDVNNMEITFTDTAFVTNMAVDVANYSQTGLIIDFIELLSDSTDILTYSFAEQTGPATIDNIAHTVDIEVAFGTDVSNLVATYTLSTGATTTVASVAQVSGVTANDFTFPVIYNVLAEDTVTNQDWIINVSIATDKDIVAGNNYKVSVYPNPANKTFTLDINSTEFSDYNISLINIQGQKIFEIENKSQKSFTRTFDIRHLSSGIYYLKIINNNKMIVEKIIIN